MKFIKENLVNTYTTSTIRYTIQEVINKLNNIGFTITSYQINKMNGMYWSDPITLIMHDDYTMTVNSIGEYQLKSDGYAKLKVLKLQQGIIETTSKSNPLTTKESELYDIY